MPKSKRARIQPCGCSVCQQHPYSLVVAQHQAINRVLATLDEKNRRRFVGLLAIQSGPRCISALARITGLSRNTIRRGKREIEHPTPKRTDRIRQPGGGRPAVEKKTRPF